MKSVILSISLLMAVSTASLGQFSLGAHVTPTFPLGDFSNNARTGFGFDVEGRFPIIGKTFFASIAFGFHSFGFEAGSSNINDVSYDITPFTASVYYPFSDAELQPYLGFGLGANRIILGNAGISVAETYFGISPAFGVRYEINEQLTFDTNLKYRYTFVGSDSDNLEGLINSVAYIPFNLGVFYTFGQ